jgi:hypothetical protein
MRIGSLYGSVAVYTPMGEESVDESQRLSGIVEGKLKGAVQ